MKTVQFSSERMSRAEAFRRACERNALRRHAQLPLIPIREAVDDELRRDAIRLYDAAADHHHEEYRRTRACVLIELREERGPDFGRSTGGRWVVDHIAGVRFRQFLASRGFVRPESRGVIYGAVRKTCG
jgi:hypothetical protein